MRLLGRNALSATLRFNDCERARADVLSRSQVLFPSALVDGEGITADERVWPGATVPETLQGTGTVLAQKMVGERGRLEVGPDVWLLAEFRQDHVEWNPSVTPGQGQQYVRVRVTSAYAVRCLRQTFLEPGRAGGWGTPCLPHYNVHDLVAFERPPLRIGDQQDRPCGRLREPRGWSAYEGRHLRTALDEEKINRTVERWRANEGTCVAKGRWKPFQEAVLISRGVGARKKVDTESRSHPSDPRIRRIRQRRRRQTRWLLGLRQDHRNRRETRNEKECTAWRVHGGE
jgi:hypothetical protein